VSSSWAAACGAAVAATAATAVTAAMVLGEAADGAQSPSKTW